MFTLKKLNARGVAHHAVLMLIVVMSVAGFGAYQVSKSHADALNAADYTVRVQTPDGCWLAGRTWQGDAATGSCAVTCRSNTSTYNKNGTNPGYCSGAVAAGADAATCVQTQHRMYILNVGCARKIDQDSTNNARQCTGLKSYTYKSSDGITLTVTRTVTSPYPNYVADYSGTADKCVEATIATPTPTGTTNNTDNVGANTNYCALLGRTGTDTACNRVCKADGATLLVGAGNVDYCSNYVATSITDAACSSYNRVSITVNGAYMGCAKRPGNDRATDALRCKASFPYYAANAVGGTDKCFASQAAFTASQTTTTTPTTPATPTCATTRTTDCTPAAGTGGSGTGANTDGSVGTDDGTYLIVIYDQKNFQGTSKRISGNTVGLGEYPDLDKIQWDNKISSFKILKGRWKLCEDKDYTTNCINPWASDADLSSSNAKNNHDNKFTSLRPFVVTTTTFEDAAEDISPTCTDASGNQVALSDGVCPAASTLTCADGLVVNDGECKVAVITANAQVYLPVDSSFVGKAGERKCVLLGREWVNSGNGGDHGCSLVTCNLEKDGAPLGQKDGKPYCVSNKFDAPYAVTMTQSKCEGLKRVWIDQVGRCAQVPNRKDKNQTVVKAPQCTGKATTYYIYLAKDKEDECFNPSFFQSAKGVAKATGGALGNVLQVGPKAFCAARSGYHWDSNSDRCKKDPPAPSAASSAAPASPVTASDPPANTSGVTAAFCAKLKRTKTATGCGNCDPSTLKMTNLPANQWDYCYKPAASSPTPATCPDGTVRTGDDCIGHGSSTGGASSSSGSNTTGITVESTHYPTGSRVTFPYPASVRVFTGSWKVCDDEAFGDRCITLPSGYTDLCSKYITNHNDNSREKVCKLHDIYFTKI